MDLNEIKVFTRVAQAGSFSGAAKQLGMPNSTVSAKVSALEKRLGVSLLRRTTRKLSLTEAGEAYLQRCLAGLDLLQVAEAEVSSSQAEAQGLLRVTAPLDMGSTCLVDLVSRFTKQNPKVRLEFLFADRIVDLVGEGVDLAIRAGALGDSGLIAKKLGIAYWAPFASPSYLKRAGLPEHPKELRDHDCLLFGPLGDASWELDRRKSTITVPLERRLVASDISFVKALAAAGYGIALLPTFGVHADVASGRLVRVLPEWRSSADPVHLVYPEQRFVAPKIRSFIELAEDAFREILRSE